MIRQLENEIMSLKRSYCVNPTQVLDEIDGRIKKIKVEGSPKLRWDPRTLPELPENLKEMIDNL